MKLIIQIPCYNEEGALPVALKALPKKIKGIAKIETMIIDDGSADNTIEVAQKNGVKHIAKHVSNQGLARAFITGLDRALREEADIIVNTDADNQYNADDIEKLVEPILKGRADLVIGTRPISDTKHFSFSKKVLQKIGSWVVRVASGSDVKDAPSGFRAISRNAAMQLNVFSSYTYTLETIIQAGHKGISVLSVPIRTNEDLRPSRLVKSIPSYLRQSMLTIVRSLMAYSPFRFFTIPGIISFIAGFVIGIRFLVYYITDGGAGHIQSLILASVLLGSGIFLIIIGLIADLISVNRKLLEQIDFRLKRIELNNGKK